MRAHPSHHLEQRNRHRARLVLGILLALLLVGILLVGAISARLGFGLTDTLQALQVRTPGELVRYAERRLEGHPKLEAIASPLLGAVRSSVERPIPGGAYIESRVAKGWQAAGVGRVTFDAAGHPRPAGRQPAPPPTTTRLLDSVEAITEALQSAQPADVLEVSPGTYRLARSLVVRSAGTATAPITLRAARPGSVRFEVTGGVGLWMLAPFWIVENLDWHGTCPSETDCEHAIHVVGAARSVAIVNNRMLEFNAQVKVNGADGRFPDDGLLQWSTLENRAARRTEAPVTGFDLVAASRWTVLDNVVGHFVRHRGATYGIFMKGAGEAGRIERNVVMCTREGISQPGVRVGISMGGGGTEPRSCRDRRCDFEHRQGQVVNNVVAHCNDTGIDVNRSLDVLVAHNTLVNTAGIGVRGVPATATVVNNVLDGSMRARDGAALSASGNVTGDLRRLLRDADQLDLAWRSPPDLVDVPESVRGDACGRPRPRTAPPGAGQRCNSAD